MKRLLLIALLAPTLATAQFTDNFTDGDFTNAPTWSGDDVKFEVLANELHLNAPAATDVAYLSTPSLAIDAALWEFYVRLEFNPSSSNRAYVYLVSDQADLNGPLNGYFVMIGNTADEVSLYRQDGGSSVKIIDGTDGTVDSDPVTVRVQVTRDASGNWELLHDVTGGSTFTSEGTVNDITYTGAAYFGVFCDYTATRSTLFYYDDFVVTGNPFSGPAYDTAQFREIVINEIMADPSPPVGLPDAEFVELYNTTTADTFNLSGFTFTDGSSTATLGDYVLNPDEYVIVCPYSDTIALQGITANVLGVGSFPSLNNSGDNLELQNALGTIIDQVNYTDSWYADPAKEDGGWTLEQINPFTACASVANWSASNNSTGGTPGAVNSIFDPTPDTQAPTITDIYVNTATHITVQFSEVIDSSTVTLGNFGVSGGITVLNVAALSPDYTRADVFFLTPIDTGLVYTLTITNVADCEGNLLIGSNDFSLPYQARIGDVVINEVLFNPYTNGSDFVEIYNNSTRVIGLSNWQLANYDDDTISNHDIITTLQISLNPGEFVVLTVDSLDVRNDYPLFMPGTFLEMSALPTYANDSGTVYLIDNLNRVMDAFSYDEDMHFALLNDPDGVSLERIDYNRPTNDATNWHSAAEAVGWATPGYENSQFYPAAIPDDAVTIDPETFSPDNDGYQDVVNIHYTFETGGFVGNLTIFDSHGRTVRYVMQNELLSATGIVSWDGTTETAEKASVGIYVILFEVFDLQGTVTHFKRTCVVASRF